LIQVLEKAGITSADKLIFLGDYVDGWSESAQVLEYLIDLEKTNSCIFIKRNHDAWCEEWLRTGVANTTWMQHGGAVSIESFQEINDGKRSEILLFFAKMKMYYVDNKNRLFIHAGFTSMHGPEKEVYATNYCWDRTLWEVALSMDSSLKRNSAVFPKRLKLFEEIYIGHTPTLNYDIDTPMNRCNVWNIDTGAGFIGKLTVLDVSTKQFWQSEAVQNFIP